ncbi:MAG TPA: hypothetical protein VH592_23875 [Gemmataceae bacterium]|jgi:hypothetical protein
MTKTYMINAWCLRPFIATIDINADTPQEAIAIVRGQLGTLLDTAEECNGNYPWDQFAAYGDNGNELLRVLDESARLHEAAPKLRETLLYVAQELAGFKPDYLRQIGLNVALEQVEKALDLVDNPATQAFAKAAKDHHD